MHGVKLTNDEINRQLQEGRNYKRLYFELKTKFDALKAEHLALQEQVKTVTEAQSARIEQLEAMVFGRKNRLPRQPKLRLTLKRDSSTYHRPIPPTAAITATEPFVIDYCRRCGHSLTNKTEVIRYEEDIVLAALKPELDTKKVTKQVIERGWCSRCGQHTSAKDIRGQAVALGPVVRTYVTYLICHLDLSYTQVQDLLWQQHGLYLASSELSTILAERRAVYLPLYEQLKSRVRAGPAHMDETRYPIQTEQAAGYAHVMASATSDEVVFALADSRGKGNSQKLVGNNYQGVGITDRYGAYKHLFVEHQHQICWVHLVRTARDIASLQCLDELTRRQAQTFYQNLSGIYTAIRKIRTEPFDLMTRQTQVAHLMPGVEALCQPAKLDPKQLADLKTGVLEYLDCLFVCLVEPNVPPDNNKAERALRKLVLKRKKSFGVKTMKGARTMEVLHSVVQSLSNRDKTNLLRNLHHLATA